jgi:hypothetical protein
VRAWETTSRFVDYAHVVAAVPARCEAADVRAIDDEHHSKAAVALMVNIWVGWVGWVDRV